MSNAAGQPRATRAAWADGLDLRTPPGTAQVVFHVGSTLAYDASRWQALRKIVRSVEASGVSVTHLGADEGSSGSLAFDLGFVAEARSFANSMIEAVRKTSADTLVTFSAPALAAFRAIYPRFGVTFGSTRVLHISEYLVELAHAGRVRFHKPAALRETSAAYHDPCKLGRLSEPWRRQELGLDNLMNGIYVSREPQTLRFGNEGCFEPPRDLLRLMGVDVIELERHHASSYCCGGCGGVKETVPEAAALAARNRLAEVADLPTATLVSGCSGCSIHLGQHVDAAVQVVDLLALIGEAIEPAHSARSIA